MPSTSRPLLKSLLRNLELLGSPDLLLPSVGNSKWLLRCNNPPEDVLVKELLDSQIRLLG